MMQDFEDLRAWIGRSESACDQVTAPLAHRIGALLDRDDPYPTDGDILASGWHTLLCPPVVRHSNLGPDGHPERGGFIPPIPYKRRMAAGSRITFHRDLKIGQKVRRDSEITNIEHKQGSAGDMIILTFENRFVGPYGLAVEEEQKAVFLNPTGRKAPSSKALPAPAEPQWRRRAVTDSVMIFRFAALNYCGHRIHYDTPYARQEEKCETILSSAGLHTLLMFDAARENFDRPIRQFSSRNIRPISVDCPISICGTEAETSGQIWLLDQEGALAVSAAVSFE